MKAEIKNRESIMLSFAANHPNAEFLVSHYGYANTQDLIKILKPDCEALQKNPSLVEQLKALTPSKG
jgi:type III secretion system FlhB-like substrate exporter